LNSFLSPFPWDLCMLHGFLICSHKERTMACPTTTSIWFLGCLLVSHVYIK
jgi:hypothetical protein